MSSTEVPAEASSHVPSSGSGGGAPKASAKSSAQAAKRKASAPPPPIRLSKLTRGVAARSAAIAAGTSSETSRNTSQKSAELSLGRVQPHPLSIPAGLITQAVLDRMVGSLHEILTSDTTSWKNLLDALASVPDSVKQGLSLHQVCGARMSLTMPGGIASWRHRSATSMARSGLQWSDVFNRLISTSMLDVRVIKWFLRNSNEALSFLQADLDSKRPTLAQFNGLLAAAVLRASVGEANLCSLHGSLVLTTRNATLLQVGADGSNIFLPQEISDYTAGLLIFLKIKQGGSGPFAETDLWFTPVRVLDTSQNNKQLSELAETVTHVINLATNPKSIAREIIAGWTASIARYLKEEIQPGATNVFDVRTPSSDVLAEEIGLTLTDTIGYKA